MVDTPERFWILWDKRDILFVESFSFRERQLVLCFCEKHTYDFRMKEGLRVQQRLVKLA